MIKFLCTLIICLIVCFSGCDFSVDQSPLQEPATGLSFSEGPQFGASTYPLAVSESIAIDGKSTDWNQIPALTTEKNQSALVLKAAHSQEFLYICVTGRRMGPNYGAYLNTDDNASTGYQGSPWGSAGFDYLVENGSLYRSLGPGWSWEYLGGAQVLGASNSSVVELRIEKSILANLADSITLGFIDIGAYWTIKSIIPKLPPLPHYTITTGEREINVLVPAYFYPGPSWDALAVQAALMPGRLIAVANPGSGPGTIVDPNYTNAIGNVRNSQGRIVGYVYTDYGNRPLSEVIGDIDTWYRYYSIDGIFLDQQANVSGKELFYQTLYQHIKSNYNNGIVIGNPGATTIESYLFYQGNRITDILCIFETDSGFLDWQPPLWCSNYGSENFCVLPFNTSDADYRTYVDHAVEQKTGWVFCTNDVLPNPWDTIPRYFTGMCDYIRTSY